MSEIDKTLGSLSWLLQSSSALVQLPVIHPAQADEPRLTTQTVQLGNLGQIWPHVRSPHKRPQVSGAGVGLDDGQSLLPALGESLERYSTCVFEKEQFITATAEELGRDALDLDSIPRCSPNELSHTRCPLVAPDKKVPMRWVQSLSLLDGRTVYVPVVMVYLYAGFDNPGERIWSPITTGCAAHRSYDRALIAAILEVIERDALSITWLQKLSLPRIVADSVPESLAAYWDRYQRSSRELNYVFFDATTDLGVPTIYGVQVAKANKGLTTVVSCSTAFDPAVALRKVLCDMAALRVGFGAPRQIPESWDDFCEVFHGATYMGRPEQAHAFNFLLQSGDKRDLSGMAKIEYKDDRQALQMVLAILHRRKLEAYAVDLSTDEALRVGVRVVRVVIPGLQPVGFLYRARYLGHRRLYDAPLQLGYPSRAEADLNHWPQPFA